jgi:hypothetical protein
MPTAVTQTRKLEDLRLNERAALLSALAEGALASDWDDWEMPEFVKALAGSRGLRLTDADVSLVLARI